MSKSSAFSDQHVAPRTPRYSRRAILSGSASIAAAIPLVGLAGCVPPNNSQFGNQFGGNQFGGQFGGNQFGGQFGGPTQVNSGQVGLFVNLTNQLRFDPQHATINLGQTVVWRNISQVVHTVTFDPRLARDRRHVILPRGVQPFTTGDVLPGQSVNFQFTVPGEYRYFCIPHEQQNMLGNLRVVV